MARPGLLDGIGYASHGYAAPAYAAPAYAAPAYAPAYAPAIAHAAYAAPVVKAYAAPVSLPIRSSHRASFFVAKALITMELQCSVESKL